MGWTHSCLPILPSASTLLTNAHCVVGKRSTYQAEQFLCLPHCLLGSSVAPHTQAAATLGGSPRFAGTDTGTTPPTPPPACYQPSPTTYPTPPHLCPVGCSPRDASCLPPPTCHPSCNTPPTCPHLGSSCLAHALTARACNPILPALAFWPPTCHPAAFHMDYCWVPPHIT